MDTIYTAKDTGLQIRYVFHFNEQSFPYEKMDSPEFRIDCGGRASTDASLEILLSYDDPSIVILKNVTLM